MAGNLLKDKLIELLLIFQEVCEQNGLVYYASGGTALGAVRHKGFIPWDDDIDVVMPRKDYDRLLNGDGIKLPEGITVRQSEKMFMYFMDSRIKITHGNKIWDQESPYLSIDIFPVDGAPDHALFRWLYITYTLFWFALLKMKQIKFIRETESLKNRKKRPLAEKLLIRYGSVIHYAIAWLKEEEIKEKYLKSIKKYSYENAKVAGVYCGRYRWKDFWPKEYFGPGKVLEFENVSIKTFSKVNHYLEDVYGKDYMCLPPVEEREKHGDIRIVDCGPDISQMGTE